MNHLDLFADKKNGLDLFAVNETEATKPAEPPKQQGGGFLDEAIGAGETALSIGSSMIAEPAAGLAGIYAAATDGVDAGTKAIEETRQAMTYQPRTDEGKENIQGISQALEPIGTALKNAEQFLGDLGFEVAGPAGGAIAGSLPTAAMELLGLKGIRTARGQRKVTGITDDAAESLKKNGVDIDDLSDEAIAKVQAKSKEDILDKAEDLKQPEEKQYKKILSNIEKSKAKKSAQAVMPDKSILDAAKDLGIDLNPSHYSKNQLYIELEQKLKDRPGSLLNSKEVKAIERLGERADGLIQNLGGTIDKSLLDSKVKTEISGSIDELSAQASNAYKKIESTIPKQTIVSAGASKNYIAQVLNELGGDASRLTPDEADLYKLSKKEKITYAALDRLRKDIGRGFKGKGPYKDGDTSLLKQVYAKISEDQQNVAKAFGVGDDYALARKLVQSRKQIEGKSIELFGRDVNKSIVPQLKSSATALTKGDVSKFNKLMDALPENMREEAAVSMLGDLFVQDARSATGMSQGFVKAFEGLNRNKKAKVELFKYIPKEGRRRFNNLGKVATGLYRAKAFENKSGTAKSLISAMDDGGMFKRIHDVGGRVALAEGVSSSIGLPGVGAAGVVGSVLAKGKKAASASADEFITSKVFTKAVKEAAEGNVKNANDMINKSKQFKKWVKFANKGDIEAISTVGFIPWLTGQTGEEEYNGQ